MGFKRDIFIVKIKKEFEYAEHPDIIKLISEKYHQLFSILWNQFHNLSELIDNKNTNQVISLLEKESRLAKKDPSEYMFDFFGQYRLKDCLQQILREKFFDTILIIQNSYSMWGVNMFYVLEKDQLLNISLIRKNSLKENSREIPQNSEGNVLDREIAKISAEDLISEYNWSQEDPTELKYLRSKIVNMKEESIDPIQDPL